MKKSVLKLKGVKELTIKEQKVINGGYSWLYYHCCWPKPEPTIFPAECGDISC